MTPRNPWRRDWVRETLVPALCMSAVIMLLAFALAGTVKADSTRVVDVCGTLDANPTPDGVQDVLYQLLDAGLTPYSAGSMVGAAVHESCPEHLTEIRLYVARQHERRA